MNDTYDTPDTPGSNSSSSPVPPSPDIATDPGRAAGSETQGIRGIPTWLVGLTLGLLLVVLAVFVFQQLADILKPLFIAGFLGYLIMPVHRFLAGFRVPTVVSYVVLVAVIMMVGFVFSRITIKSFGDLKDNFPKYEAKIDAVRTRVEGALDWIYDRLNPHRAERTTERATEGTAEDTATAPAGSRKEPRAEIMSRDLLGRQLTSILNSFAGFILAMFVVVVYLGFLLAEMEGIQRRVGVVFGKERGQDVLRVFDDINRAISRYISVKVFIAFLVGFLTTVALAVLGVEFFILWGILSFLFNFVPYVGSIVASAPPIAMAFLQFGVGWRVMAVAVLLIVVQNVVGYVVEPRLTGRKLGVSPLLTLLGLAFWYWLWGVVGMILAVPLVVILKIVLEHIDATRPIAALMSGSPPVLKPPADVSPPA